MDAQTPGWGNLAAWADKAKKSANDLSQAAYETVQGDPEKGEAAGTPQWSAWAKGAADRARQNLEKAAEHARTADIGEKAKSWQTGMASTIGKMSEDAAKAGSGLSEQAKVAGQKASNVAGSAKDGLSRSATGLATNVSKGASGLAGGVSGMGMLATNPKKLAQFAGIFMIGMFLLSMSLSFLPLLPVAPQKFALLFAMGSMTVLGSVAFLKGPMAFKDFMLQRDKLFWSVCYVVGLIGTLWATLIARSYLFTAVFAIMQAVGLTYFLASFVPGGQMILNCFGRLGAQCARGMIWR